MSSSGYPGLPSYYFESSNPLTPNLGLALWGMDPIVAENMVLLDTAVGGGAGGGFNFNVPKAGTPNVPSPLYTGANETPDLMNAAFYGQDVNGQWHVWGGMDEQTVNSSSGPPPPAGTMTFTKRTYFRDTLASTQGFKNAFIGINHEAGVGTVQTNQDRALGIQMNNYTATIFNFSITSNVVTMLIGSSTMGANINRFQVGQNVIPSGLSVGTYLNGVTFTVSAAGVPANFFQTIILTSSSFTHADVSLTSDSGALDMPMYSMACVQAELDIYGAPQLTGNPDGEFSCASFQTSDNHTGTMTANGFGVNAIRATHFREAGAGFFTGSFPAVARLSYVNDSKVDAGNGTAYGLIVTMSDFGPSVNAAATAIWVNPTGFRFSNFNTGIKIDGYNASVNDIALNVTSGNVTLGGTTTINAIASVTTWPSQSANTILAGPTSGGNAAATFRLLVANDYVVMVGDSGSGGVQGAVPAPGAGDAAAGKFLSAAGNWSVPPGSGGSTAWSAITNAAAGLTLANGNFATTFDQTSAVNWLWANTTAATSGTAQSSPILQLAGQYWNGSASAADTWSIQVVVGNGTNGTSGLQFSHSGSTGQAQLLCPAGLAGKPGISFPGFTDIGMHVVTTDWIAIDCGNNGNLSIYSNTTEVGHFSTSTTLGFGMSANAGSSIYLSASASTSHSPIYMAPRGNWTQTSGSCIGIRMYGDSGLISASAFAPTSGTATFTGLLINPTINQTGTASGSYSGIQLSVVETAVLGTANKLLDLQAGATGVTSRFSVDNTGLISLPNSANAGFGNGAAGTSVTTTLLGTGSGPAAPQTVVQYAKISVNGSTFWIPLMQ